MMLHSVLFWSHDDNFDKNHILISRLGNITKLLSYLISFAEYRTWCYFTSKWQCTKIETKFWNILHLMLWIIKMMLSSTCLSVPKVCFYLVKAFLLLKFLLYLWRNWFLNNQFPEEVNFLLRQQILVQVNGIADLLCDLG